MLRFLLLRLRFCPWRLFISSFVLILLAAFDIVGSSVVGGFVVIVLGLVARWSGGLFLWVVVLVELLIGVSSLSWLLCLLIVVAVVILKIYVKEGVLRELAGWRWAALEEYEPA